MPVVFQKFISREDLDENPEVIYLFGDNCERAGLGGQAREMRGAPNAIGVRTKLAPNMRRSAFFSEGEAEAQNVMIDEDLEPAMDHLREGGVVVIPLDGLGTGLSRLAEMAPSTWVHLNEQLNRMGDI